MDFPKEFLRCVDTINNNNYNYGNEVLYQNCGFSCLKDTGKLSSAIWLIGKSYSADPTRSAPKDTFSNKGLGSSFERIATELLNSGNYEEFYNQLENLREKKYTYPDTDPDTNSDLKILKETVSLVHTLNTMIKNAMSKVAEDKKLEKLDSDNVVSFCSKFLHFMCPHLFFIIDSYSRNGGHTLFSTRTNQRTLYIQDQKDDPQNMVIDSTAKKHFHDNYLSSPSASYHEPAIQDYYEPAIQDYYEHCLRAYGLARFLHANKKYCLPQIAGDENSRYMPRLVDSILMRITD